MGQGEKTALVLSAGGVFGAYQVGVWKALADYFQPDLVVGASIGSINGWLIAGGCRPEELEYLWLNSDDHRRIRPRVPRHWSHGWLDLSPIEEIFARLYSRFTPRAQYAVVLTDFLRLQPRVFTGDDVTWRHVLASCAVPLAFDLPRLEGRVYADGGLLGALPLWAALALGATRLIAVNPMPVAPWPVRALASAARGISRHPGAEPAGIEVVSIVPDQPLGSYYGMLRYRPELIRKWIEQGERDAVRAKHSISKCFERQ